MSKIIQAVNVMISNPHNIGTIIPTSRDEYFFTYKGKQAESKWSVRAFEDEYFLHFYPGDQGLEALAIIDDWTNVPIVTYATQELKTREARESFSELYRVVKQKLYNVDAALEDIIEAGDERPW